MEHVSEALTFFVVFLFSTTLHEAAHAWAALKGGDRTAYEGGQVSLDPRPHIRREPFGMVVLPLLSSLATGWPMGYASAPYNVAWARAYPRHAAWMALAGPGANLLLAVIAAAALRGGELAGVFYAPESIRFGDIAGSDAGAVWLSVGRLLSAFFSMNLLLMVFNLLPFPPLDGSAAITLLMDKGTTSKYQDFIWSTPILGVVGLFAAWQMFDVVFRPFFIIAVNLVFSGANYG